MKKIAEIFRTVPPIILFTAFSILTIPGAMIAWIAYLAIQGQAIDAETVLSSIIVGVACCLASAGVIVVGVILNDKNDF